VPLGITATVNFFADDPVFEQLIEVRIATPRIKPATTLFIIDPAPLSEFGPEFRLFIDGSKKPQKT
jgi:hypothetical protein